MCDLDFYLFVMDFQGDRIKSLLISSNFFLSVFFVVLGPTILIALKLLEEDYWIKNIFRFLILIRDKLKRI